MLAELSPAGFPRVRPFFAEPHLRPVIDGVIAGNSPGRIWVDDAEQPRAAYLWDNQANHYLVGQADDGFARKVGALLAQAVLPASRARGLQVLKMIGAEGWEDRIDALLPDADLGQRPRHYYALGQPLIPNWSTRLSRRYTLCPVDADLLARQELSRLDELTAEIRQCWVSVDAFLRHGVGLGLLDGGRLICWCLAEYVSEGRCGIGIETAPDYQRRGLATLTAAAFVQRCGERGLTPHWDCWADNIGSTRVAEKVGFTLVSRYAARYGLAVGEPDLQRIA